MRQIQLKVRVYGPYAHRLLHDIEQKITEEFGEIDVIVSKLKTNKRGFVSLSLTGSDEEFAANVLRSKYGRTLSFADLNPGITVPGWLVEVGKVGYGFYIDIGVTEPDAIDVLVPLYKLREQLKMPRYSLRRIAKSHLLVDNLPINVTISELDQTNSTIEGYLSTTFLERLDYWINDEHERLFVFGANYHMIENALRKTHHLEDIYEIESLGIHEHILVCKRSTRASGIIVAIGPKLRGVPMHLFIPRELKVIHNGST